MYDIGKALIMVTQALMFVVALTIAVALYYGVMDRIDGVMLSTDYSNRGDSIVGFMKENSTREVERAEVIVAILNLKDHPENSVVVSGLTFSYSGDANEYEVNGHVIESLEGSLSGIISGASKYTLSYSNSKQLRYQ